MKLERPRHRLELADDPEYNHYRAAVLSFLYEKQRKPDDAAAQPVKNEKKSDGNAENNNPAHNVQDTKQQDAEQRSEAAA